MSSIAKAAADKIVKVFQPNTITLGGVRVVYASARLKMKANLERTTRGLLFEGATSRRAAHKERTESLYKFLSSKFTNAAEVLEDITEGKAKRIGDNIAGHEIFTRGGAFFLARDKQRCETLVGDVSEQLKFEWGDARKQEVSEKLLDKFEEFGGLVASVDLDDRDTALLWRKAAVGVTFGEKMKESVTQHRDEAKIDEMVKEIFWPNPELDETGYRGTMFKSLRSFGPQAIVEAWPRTIDKASALELLHVIRENQKA